MVSPRVSIIVPLYESESTLLAFLSALGAQCLEDCEVLLVDSSASTACAEIASTHPVRYLRSDRRLLPQEARTLGVEQSTGQLLVFTDPDCCPAPNWLAQLVAAHRAHGGPIVGSIACHGRRWFDLGLHFCKFSKWLPGRKPRAVDMAPTANLLCPRSVFLEVGGFGHEGMLGDTTLSLALRRAGHQLRFEPAACVEHHHEHRWRSFLRERYQRGKLYGQLRLREAGRGAKPLFVMLRIGSLPLRVASNLLHSVRHAREAGQAWCWIRTMPITILGYTASVLGETLGYWQALRATPPSDL
jgi:GT2 family glycosyltransferase